jgi:hypothetical protein
MPVVVSVWGDEREPVEDALRGDPRTFAEVVDRLTQLQVVLDRTSSRGPDNSISSFNRLYAVITRDILARLERSPSDGGFHDRQFTEILDVEFAKLYLEALRLWSASDAPTPKSWSLLFRHRDAREVPPLLCAILGITAHICFDLPNALVDTFKVLGAAPQDDKRYKDYLRINEILHQRIPELRDELSEGNLKALFHRLSGPVDEWFEGAALVFARNRAWDDACELWLLRDDVGAYAAELAALDTRAVSLGKVAMKSNDVVPLFFE